MLPVLIDAFGRAPDPMRAMNRFDDLVTRLPSGVNFYRLLEARPGLTDHLGTHSQPRAGARRAARPAAAIARRPDRRHRFRAGAAGRGADRAISPAPSARARIISSLLDRVRRRVNERRFALGVQLIVAHSDPIEVAEGYSRVAEAAINVLADAAIAEFEAAHGRVPGSELLVMGLGRLGGEALTHASDLDLVYLFTGTHEAESDGPRPLRATDYFNRLAPRVTAALSVPTASGPLYDVDTRLRPSGTDGMLAVILESFARYQSEQAWTWEHMALTRARPVFGSAEGRAALSGGDRIARLARPRDPERLVADAVAMRAEMASHKAASGTLRHQARPGRAGRSRIRRPHASAEARYRPSSPSRGGARGPGRGRPGVGDDIDPALRLLTRMLVMFRLVSPESDEPPDDDQAPGRRRLRPSRLERSACGARRGAAEGGGAVADVGVVRATDGQERDEMLSEGDQVPDVKLTSVEGKAISPADFGGQKLVLYFYPKDDTSGCTAEAQAFTALADEFKNAGTWILGVSKDDSKKHRSSSRNTT